MAVTWSNLSARSSKAVCTTGSEAASTLTATAGSLLDGVGGYAVHVMADSGQTITAGGILQAYLYNDAEAIWGRFPDGDLTPMAAGVRANSFLGFSVPSPRGRVAYLPSGLTVSSGSVTVEVLTTSSQGGTAGTFAN